MIEAEATAMARALASLVVALVGGVNGDERTAARDHATLIVNAIVDHWLSFLSFSLAGGSDSHSSQRSESMAQQSAHRGESCRTNIVGSPEPHSQSVQESISEASKPAARNSSRCAGERV
jgi:hypothetical protein